MSLQEAFLAVCSEAKPAVSHFVSLYLSEQYYGGAEEGGWWGNDVSLVATQEYPSYEAAQAAAEAVQVLADKLTAEARTAFHEHCAAQCEWLDARGLDADYLPEVGGADSYSVRVEKIAGNGTSQGCRHYE